MGMNYIERLDHELAEPVKKSLGRSGMDLSDPSAARVLSDNMSPAIVEQWTDFKGVTSKDRKMADIALKIWDYRLHPTKINAEITAKIYSDAYQSA